MKKRKQNSFGNPHYDSFPNFFLPIGFAGGLEDPDTGLIRFGWRDYDPTVGRFTAPDPARDMRGDGDLYDYCVDDPVSCVDPAGLWAFPLLFLAGKALSTAIAGAGLYGVASLVGHGAKEAIDEVFPIVGGIQAATALPVMAAAGAEALAPLARQAGTALWSNAQRTAGPIARRAGEMANDAWQRFGPAAMGTAQAAAEFADGALTPGPPHGGSGWGVAGSLAAEFYKELELKKSRGGLR